MSCRRVMLAFGLALSLLLLSGCAAQKSQLQQEGFFEEWRLLADDSKGHSPAPRRESVLLEPLVEQVETITGLEEELRPMPTRPVSMHLWDVPITSVLRSLARLAELNLIINPAITGSTDVHLHNVAWDQAFRGVLATHGLTYAWEGDILRVMTIDDMEHDLRLAAVKEKKGAHRIEIGRVAPLASQIVKISYANAEELRETLLAMLTKDGEGNARGSVVVDRHSNSLVIQATQEDLARVGRMIAVLDRPRPQVLIEATIVEASKSVARDLGVQWSGRYLAGQNRPHGITEGLDPAALLPATGQETLLGGGTNPDGSPITSALGLLYGSSNWNFLSLQLQALQEDGKVNILSQPSITTMDNQMAFTENGTRIPVVTTTDGDRTVRYENAVLRLEITPNIIDADNLRMKIAVTKDEVDLSRQVEGNPFIIKKQTETNLNVANGETIVISGLTKQQLADTNSGVPGLKDIPGLGWFFRGSSKASGMEEVLIFLTPVILPQRIAAP
ncbi:MAG TPA: type IV pilus secretin PilQ [Desulfurivibrio alkaliphilus]|uniref:Type IV pilus secretin PilQ n=1 Tax=Desulfurivibrio alkaliphilus TaxID=427923 RepID=A0A7C2TGV4_9BACT|nr:type IV pilus secretin PilQ [Desulfurivibrio alkaliphilus]